MNALAPALLARLWRSACARVQRLSTYAAAPTHGGYVCGTAPGVNVPAARRSVGLHLSRLYLLLEGGWSMERANNAMLAITEFKDRCEWLEPAHMLGALGGGESLQEACE